MPSRYSTDYRNLRPYVLEDVRAIVSAGSAGSNAAAALTAHRLNDTTYHIGQLDPSQATWALTTSAGDARYVTSSRQVIAGAGLTGGGALTGDVTLTVGAGDGISVAADTVALASTVAGAGLTYTTGVLAVGVANTGAAGLTVEADVVRLTSSSNPGAAASVLASDASGHLSLVRLTTTDRLRGPLWDTASGNATLQPAGDVVLDPVGNDVLPATNYDINLGMLSKKYLSLHAAELWVETLVAQNTIATIGGRILVGPTTTLTRDLAAAATTIYVKHNQMASGDRAYMEANGSVEFFAITSAPTTISATEYSYTVTRNLDGSGANDWYAGDAMFNTGTTGDGFIDLYSIRGVKSGSQYGPTIVGNVRLSATYNDWAERWAAGNLNGLYGYGVDTYGFAAGNPAAAWAAMDATNGVRMMAGAQTRLQLGITGNLRLYDNAGTPVISLDNDGSSYFAGVMTLGTSGEIRQGTGTLGSNYTGLRIWRDLNIGLIGGYNNNVPQWYANTDGRLYAGAGNTIIDSAGVTLKLDTGILDGSSVKWATAAGGTTQGYLGAYRSSGAGNIHVYLSALPNTVGAKGTLHLAAYKQDNTAGDIDFLGLATFQHPVEIQGGNGVLLNLLGTSTGQTLLAYNPRNTGRKAYIGFNTAANGDFSVMQEESGGVGNLLLGANSAVRLAVHYDGRVASGAATWYSNEAFTANGVGSNYLLGVHNANGYMQIGPNNATYCHILTDRSYFYVNKPFAVDGAISAYAQDMVLQRDGYEKLRLHSNGALLTGAFTLATVYTSGTGKPSAPSAGAILYMYDTGTVKELRIVFAGGTDSKIIGT